MFFKLKKITAPYHDGEAYRVDLLIIFAKLPTGEEKLHFGEISIFLPARDIEALSISQIETLAVAAARNEIQ